MPRIARPFLVRGHGALCRVSMGGPRGALLPPPGGVGRRPCASAQSALPRWWEWGGAAAAYSVCFGAPFNALLVRKVLYTLQLLRRRTKLNF